MNYKEELNAGYLLTLENTENGLAVKRINIDYPETLIPILDKMDYYEENKENFDVFDVERFVERRSFDKEDEYSYCWPYNYNDAFKSKAKIEKVDRDRYYQKMKEIEERIAMEYERLIKSKRWVNNHYVYLDESQKQELERKKREKIEKEKEELRQEYLQNYIVMVRRYIFAQQYKNAVQTIKEKSLMYSSEEKGWYKPNYNITGNARIGLRTNFCYGKSAYFDILLNYKGIDILPYSDLVKYYWSNMMDNQRCTRSYKVYRYNWSNVLTFVAEICNWIESDPISFETKWIIEEVEIMMEGLKEIHEAIEEYYKKLMNAKKEEDLQIEETKKIIRYRNITASEISQHDTYPHETLLTIQVDKLAAALSLLEDLTRLKSIYAPIAQYIETIVQYNKEIIPAIRIQCKELKIRIFEKEKEVKRVEKDIKIEEKKLEIRENEINAEFDLLEGVQGKASMSDKINKKINDGEYRKIEEHLSELKEVKRRIEQDIYTRQAFKDYLEGRQEFIKEHLIRRGNV